VDVFNRDRFTFALLALLTCTVYSKPPRLLDSLDVVTKPFIFVWETRAHSPPRIAMYSGVLRSCHAVRSRAHPRAPAFFFVFGPSTRALRSANALEASTVISLAPSPSHTYMLIGTFFGALHLSHTRTLSLCCPLSFFHSHLPNGIHGAQTMDPWRRAR